MTYLELYEHARHELNHNRLNLGEWSDMIEPLRREIPKTGHWIHHPEVRFICTEHWECSVCHKSTMTNPVYKVNDYNNMYFCPKCGTKMAESEVQDADCN